MTYTDNGVRWGDTVYSDPIILDDSQRVYPAGTVLVTVTYDDGDRFVTVASRRVREALGVAS